jgi:hypothetical protein
MRIVPGTGLGKALRAPARRRSAEASYRTVVVGPGKAPKCFLRFRNWTTGGIVCLDDAKNAAFTTGSAFPTAASAVGDSDDTSLNCNSTDYVAVFAAINEYVASSTRSYAIWVNQKNTTAAQTIISGDAVAAYPELSVPIGTVNVNWTADKVADATGVTWTNVLPGNGEWAHLLLVVNAATDATLYVNGVSQGTIAHTTNFNGTPGKLLLGAAGSTGTTKWSGQLDEFAMYFYALSGADALVQYELGRQPLPTTYNTGSASSYQTAVLATTPALYWLCDQPSSSYYFTDLTDNSRHGYTGGVTTLTYGDTGHDSINAATWAGPTSNSEVTHWVSGRAVSYQPFVQGSSRSFSGVSKIDSTSSANKVEIFGGSASGNKHPVLEVDIATKDVYWWTDITNFPGGVGRWDAAWPAYDAWVHWILTYNATTFAAALYLNGTGQGGVDTDPVALGDYNATNSNLQLGARGKSASPEVWDGSMQHFAVWERILSGAEIDTLSSVAEGALGIGGIGTLRVGVDPAVRQPTVLTVP